MIRLLGAIEKAFGISGFVEKQIHTLDHFAQFRTENGVGAVGKLAGRCGRCGEHFVRQHLAVFCCPAGSGLDVVDLAERNVVGVNHLPSDVRKPGVLAEQVTAGWDAV